MASTDSLRAGLLPECRGGGFSFRKGREGFLRLGLFEGTGAYSANDGCGVSAEQQVVELADLL